MSAVFAVVPAALIAALCVVLPPLKPLANFSWFIGLFFGFTIYHTLMKRRASMREPAAAG